MKLPPRQHPFLGQAVGAFLLLLLGSTLQAEIPGLKSPIFVDDFERGDTSAWSQTLGMASLEVQLDLPQALRTPRLTLVVQRLPTHQVLRRVELKVDVLRKRIQGLPRAPLAVTLEAPPWRFQKQIDLRSGEGKGNVLFSPRPTWLRGIVYRGDQPHAANLRLRVDLERDGELLVPTTDLGSYEVALFRPGTYTAVVELIDRGGPPHPEVLYIPDEATFEHDFRIPAITLRIQVVDAQTDEGVAAAAVLIKIHSADGRILQETVATNTEGWAKFEHALPGTAEVLVVADEYRVEQVSKIPISADAKPPELTVVLKPID